MLILLISPGAAEAALHSVEFCGQYRTSLADASSSVGDDYLTSNAGVKTKGAFMAIESGGTIIHSGYADNNGCYGPYLLSSTVAYTVKMYSVSRHNPVASIYNYVTVMDNDTDENLYGLVVKSGWSPTMNQTVSFKSPKTNWWNVQASLTTALRRHSVGVTGMDAEVYVEQPSPPPCGSFGCIQANRIYLNTYSSRRKYITTHEMGHLVGRERDEGYHPNVWDTTSAIPTGGCKTFDPGGTSYHEMNSREYQSGAAVEGLANFYAAVAFNDRTDTDDSCTLRYWGDIDWDLDGFEEDSQDVNCNGAPMVGMASDDYRNENCVAPFTNAAVEYDYLRFFWDLTRTNGADLTAKEVFDIWDQADPKNWVPLMSIPTDLSNAADDLSFGSDWDTWAATNGVD